LPAGTVLSAEHLNFLRPCPADALPPYRITQVIGKTLSVNGVAGQHISIGSLA
jgi:sialic acid synthase SpsE